jgi:tRNA nucleotidyltransferase (CCA-adding enzyme)
MLDLLKIIEEHGFVAYYVGGYPRDHYMGLETDDYDLCTNARPVDIKKFLNVDMSFSWYGNVRFVYNGHNVEITTFRKESNYEDHRHPEQVDFVETLREDLERRDFVINTLCIDSNGNYIDLLGARKDIDMKVIRAVGNADMKLSDDAIRILRAIRFAARFNFTIDSELESSINKNKYLLDQIDDKRKQKEIDKILACENGAQLLNKFGIIVNR